MIDSSLLCFAVRSDLLDVLPFSVRYVLNQFWGVAVVTVLVETKKDQHHLLEINPETQKPRDLAIQTQSSFPCFILVSSILPQLPDLRPVGPWQRGQVVRDGCILSTLSFFHSNPFISLWPPLYPRSSISLKF